MLAQQCTNIAIQCWRIIKNEIEYKVHNYLIKYIMVNTSSIFSYRMTILVPYLHSIVLGTWSIYLGRQYVTNIDPMMDNNGPIFNNVATLHQGLHSIAILCGYTLNIINLISYINAFYIQSDLHCITILYIVYLLSHRIFCLSECKQLSISSILSCCVS